MCMQLQVVVRWPREIELEDGRLLNLDNEDEITSQRLACLISKEDVENAYEIFKNLGFKRVPALPLGEKYSIAKQVNDIFEFHIRIFDSGLILSEIEISRKFIEHIFTYSINASLEVKEILEKHGIKTTLIYRGNIVKRVIKIVELEIRYDGDVHTYGSIIREFMKGFLENIPRLHIFSFLQQLLRLDKHQT